MKNTIKNIKNIKNIKKSRVFVSCFVAIAVFCAAFFGSACSGQNEYILTESTFFFVMNNMQYYPEQYLEKRVEFDCFTYDLTDVNGNVYRCGVRKCSAGYGCTCGKDTIIGFVLNYGGEIPAPKNQSENTNDKTWVHLSGKLVSANKTKIKIHAYNADGGVIEEQTETIEFLIFSVENLSVITDYSVLNYYVVK